MKAFTLISTLLAVASAAPQQPELLGEFIDTTHRVVTAPLQDIKSTVNGEKILKRMSQVPAKDGAKRTTVKYGSYMVSSTKMMSTNKMSKGPCGGTCYVTAMEATIRYPDGKEANVDTGSWLHHIALFGGGGLGGGSIWAAGNERPTLRLNEKKKYGIDFPAQFMMVIDLMVEDTKAKNLTLEITYEHVPKAGSGYAASRMYWLTIGEPAAKNGVYSFTTRPMISKTGGSLLYAIGHMHDGGTDMSLYVGSKMVCKSLMHYSSGADLNKEGSMAKSGKAAGGHSHKSRSLLLDAINITKRDGGPGGHSGHVSGGAHISAPGACTDFGTVSKGEQLKAIANYDATKHALMEMNGKKEKLMGNMRVYIGPS